MNARKAPSNDDLGVRSGDHETETSTKRDAVRQSQRIAIQLHQLIAASITVTTLRSEKEILMSLARSSRIVFDAVDAVVSLDTGPVAPLRGVARRGKKSYCEVPAAGESTQYPTSWEVGSDTRLDNGWLVAPILARRACDGGIARPARFSRGRNSAMVPRATRRTSPKRRCLNCANSGPRCCAVAWSTVATSSTLR